MNKTGMIKPKIISRMRKVCFKSEQRGLKNRYRILKIHFMELKKNMRIKLICVCTCRCTYNDIVKLQDTKNTEKTQKHSLEEISDPSHTQKQESP